MTLTPYRALHGVNLLATNNWPQRFDGLEELRRPSRWRERWSRWLRPFGIRIEPDIVTYRARYRDQDVIYVSNHLGGPAIMGSHRQIQALITSSLRDHRPLRVG